MWWQALHHAAGSINGVVASTFMLYSLGLGAGAIPTAGALNWVLKDGLGQLGTLVFGKVIAHRFDLSPRIWYMAASAKLNVATLLEITTILFPTYFLLIASFSNTLKGLAWMAGGSSRSAFNVSFAKDSNIADITAKATSQTICTSLIGTALGAGFAASIGQSPYLALSLSSIVASVHVYAGYRSVRCVPLATLNACRLRLLWSQYRLNGVVFSPEDIAKTEPILPGRPSDIQIGSLVEKVIPNACDLNTFVRSCVNGRCSLTLMKHMIFQDHETETVHLFFLEDANPQDCLLGYVHALNLLHDGLDVEEALLKATVVLPDFVDALRQCGWETDRVTVEPRRQRLTVEHGTVC